MSAPPNGAPNGTNSTALRNGAPPKPAMQKKKTNIFNTRKPKRPLPPGQRPPPPAARPPPPPVQQPEAPQQQETAEEGTYEEYPIIIDRQTIEAGLRFHAFKFQTRLDGTGRPTEANPYDERQFPRPLRLFRRYGTDKMELEEEGASGVDDKEREQALAKQAERQAEKEENRKLIAPTGGDPSKPAKKKQQKKVEEGRDDSDPVRQKRRQLRYEEAKRWHLEDKQGKNIWVGNYEEALSENSILLQIHDNAFRATPVERWYKFIQGNRVAQMTDQDIEKYTKAKARPDKWVNRLEKTLTEEEVMEAKRQDRIAKRRAELEEDEEKPQFNDEYQADRDMLDMEFNEEFQDDDEGALFQGDEGEDSKDIEKKLWDEMRNAGLGGTGVKNEELDPEEEERKRALEELEEKRKSKRLRRQLRKREHKGEYESDSDSGNRYETSSDDEDSDEEREKEEEAKKEEAKKLALANGDKSGASSRGTNTPSGRPEKRPNPDASDASGNESSRKRAKGINGTAVSTSKTQPGARSLSPNAAKPKKARSAAGSGSGSDTDTSRVGRPNLKKKSAPGSPAASNTPSGSRAGSPAADNFPTLAEVRDAIPAEGIRIPNLVALFKQRIPPKRSADFIAMVKNAGVQDKERAGVILPKPAV